MVKSILEIPSGLPVYIQNFINAYTKMDVGGIVMPCPYWMNKMKNGRVVLRGFMGGKGPVEDIKKTILNLVRKDDKLLNTPLPAEIIRKAAKRERIGIDCSGLAFRLLNSLVEHFYRNSSAASLDDIYRGGIMETNARMLTSLEFCIPVSNLQEVYLGDLIRMMGGKHVAVILGYDKGKLTYIHSSKLTQIQGVHLGQIVIGDEDKSLEQQNWLENTKQGDNLGFKHFLPDRGDGIFRLKIFTNG
jgi:hypothetical protein